MSKNKKNLTNPNEEPVEDIYSELLDAQITYLVFDDPLEKYTHLTKEEKEKVKIHILDDSFGWDYAPIAEFIQESIPETFTVDNFKKLGILFDMKKFKNNSYPKEINYRLYQDYLLNFEYGIGNEPVCFEEFVQNELRSEDYLESIHGKKL